MKVTVYASAEVPDSPEHVAMMKTMAECKILIAQEERDKETEKKRAEEIKTAAKRMDLREAVDGREATGLILGKQWPSVPGRDTYGAAATLDSAVILLRSIWGLLLPPEIDTPDMAANDFTRYAWAQYGNDTEICLQTDEEIEIAQQWVGEKAKLALEHIKKSTGSGAIQFQDICRGPDMVAAMWGRRRFHLTWPPFACGPTKPAAEATMSMDELSRQSLYTWDGVSPPTLEEVVNPDVRMEDPNSPGNFVFAYPRGPQVIQVNLTPGGRSRHTLLDLWRFVVRPYKRVAVEGAEAQWTYERGETLHYTLIAMVGKQNTEVKTSRGVRQVKADLIRLFRDDGQELVPWLCVNNPRPPWEFGVRDAIRAGTKLSLFYGVVHKDVTPFVEEIDVQVNDLIGLLRMGAGEELEVEYH